MRRSDVNGVFAMRRSDLNGMFARRRSDVNGVFAMRRSAASSRGGGVKEGRGGIDASSNRGGISGGGEKEESGGGERKVGCVSVRNARIPSVTVSLTDLET